MNKQYIKVFSCGGYSADSIDFQLNQFCVTNNINVISSQMVVTPHKYNMMRDYVLTIVYEIL